MLKNEKWPENCIWPEPLWDGNGMPWEADDLLLSPLDEECEDLLEIKEYFDSLVEEGRLNPDYSLNEDYEEDISDRDDEAGEEEDETDLVSFAPEIGSDYWDEGFDIEGWEQDFSDHINLLKIPAGNPGTDPISLIREVINYEFINENLLRQAFTRRAFALEYGIRGCSEELEFLGDSVLNTVVTKIVTTQLMEVDANHPEAPFEAKRKGLDEGALSRIRTSFVSKEYLAERAAELGLDQYILYGSGEEPTESAREDMVEALIGAAALDSGWNWEVLEDVVDRILCVQISNPDSYLKKTYYDIFNAWHQRHFRSMPSYEIYGRNPYYCAIRFSVPENDRGVRVAQRIDVHAESRSAARELAAEMAYRFVRNNGLWIDFKNAGIVPDEERSINQLQELYQKKYLEELPEYEFESWDGDKWQCSCICGDIHGFGRGQSKMKAKKRAAYMALVMLFKAAGICEDVWEKKMWGNYLKD